MTDTPERGLIDMDRVVDLVRASGFVAYVEYTGGGCATIYASKTAGPDGYPLRAAGNGERFEIAAGPGWFEGPNWTRPMGNSTDFYIGPDDDGDTWWPMAADANASDESVAQQIIDGLRGTVSFRRWEDVRAELP